MTDSILKMKDEISKLKCANDDLKYENASLKAKLEEATAPVDESNFDPSWSSRALMAEAKLDLAEREIKAIQQGGRNIQAEMLEKLSQSQSSLSLAVEALELIKERCSGERYSDYKARLESGIKAAEALSSEALAREVEKARRVERVVEAAKLDLLDEDSCLKTHKLCEHMPRTREALRELKEVK